AKEVSCTKPYQWEESVWALGEGYGRLAQPRHRVVAYDFGIKHNIMRNVLALGHDGVFLSNGPGDPEPCDYAIEAIRRIADTGVPPFGICLGHQLLAL